MSETPKPADKTTPPKPKRMWRVLIWTSASLFGVLLLLLAGGAYYTTTDDFQRRVGGEVISVLQDSTGGRVELGHITFSLWHLAIEADNLVIHGTEEAGQMPYLSAAKIFVRVRINTFLSHTTGKGSQSRIGLNFLRVEEPHIHLIVYKDGHTNQPVPKHPKNTGEPIQNTLLDLQATRIELASGLAVINDRAIPFDLAANNFSAAVSYISSTDRYAATIDLADLQTKIANQPQVQSKLHLSTEIGRDILQLKSLDFTTGASSHLTADGQIEHFDKPEWKANLTGGLELKQVGFLTGLEGFSAGIVSLDIHGHNCYVTPQVAQSPQHFWQRHHKTPPAAKVLPPSPECAAGYLLVGSVKAHGVAYAIPEVRFRDVDAAAQLRVTPAELLFTALTTTLPGGGRILGELKIENWLGEVPADKKANVASATVVAAETTANNAAKSVGAKAPVKVVQTVKPKKNKAAQTVAAHAAAAPPVDRAHAYLSVKIEGITLRTIMDMTAPPHYGDLGLDTSVAGPVEVEWGGPATEISESVKVDANLQFTPAHSIRKGALSNVPVSGQVKGHYDGSNETVNIASITLQTPSTTLAADGILGVNNGDPLTNLRLDLQARDLGEFNQLLQTLGFEVNGKKGSAAIPVDLHGTLAFSGNAHGPIRNLDVKGQLSADNLALHLGTLADIHIDSVVGDAEYSPYNGVAIASSTITRGSATLNVTGEFHPRRVLTRAGPDYFWDDGMEINVGAKLANAQATDLLQIAGQQNKVPLTGTVNLDGHAQGTIRSLTGKGNITLKDGVAYGEHYQTMLVDATVQGSQINASRVFLEAHNMSINGSGNYNIDTKRLIAQAEGKNLSLAKLDVVQTASPDFNGTLTFNADADGTLSEPNLHAKLQLAKIVYQGKALGDLNANASSRGSLVIYDVHSNVLSTPLQATGTTSLQGDFHTDAKLTFTGFDVAKAVDMFSPGAIKASSSIGGTVTLAGPLAQPKQLAGTAEFTDFAVKLQGVDLRSEGPLQASLRNGTVSLNQLHITGTDTDLKIGGSAVVFGDPNPLGGQLNLNADGSVSMLLAHTFDPDLIASGKVSFKVAADGRLKKPQLTGNVRVENVSIAVDGIPNGLSSMNGTLVFNENRLDVQQLTARTGGGDLKIGGSLIYQKGLFADLTATGDTVRVRLYGLSATANANFRLQGGPQSLLLSGNVLITRFGVGPDVDFAAFAGAGGVQLPPDPNSAANKIRLDVHVASSPQLDFQNSYAKLAGNVDLNVRGTTAVPSILGRIQITDGSATFAGTKYQLERGVIYFSNPVRIDPIIDLDAQARVENYDITIGLSGTISSLKPTYRSEPPLTEADIFALLALGRTQEEAQLYQEQQVQAGTDPTTSALLGGALNATVSNRVSRLFGAGSVKIDPAFVGTLGNSTARITVQEPLSKQLTLVFATNVNETAQQLIQVQYQITDNTSLVATRDESGVFSVVYKIRKRYR
ncbi:MAG: translocation/assembly module TamB domain-containing protein [Acidobacteriota bacterium]